MSSKLLVLFLFLRYSKSKGIFLIIQIIGPAFYPVAARFNGDVYPFHEPPPGNKTHKQNIPNNIVFFLNNIEKFSDNIVWKLFYVVKFLKYIPRKLFFLV